MFIILYGLLILYVFCTSRKMEWHYMVVPIIPFGFQYTIVNYYTCIQANMREKNKNVISYQKLFFYCEVHLSLSDNYILINSCIFNFIRFKLYSNLLIWTSKRRIFINCWSFYVIYIFYK